jgi:hypothetical protein
MFRRKWWVAAALVFVFGLLTISNLACSAFGIRNWEEYAHEVVAEDGRFELRAYEPCIIATTQVAGNMGEASGPSFRRLAGYIFGDNIARDDIAMTVPVLREEKNPRSEKIAMTMPVTRAATEDGWTMSFVMPASHTMESLPRPNGRTVRLEEQPGVTKAAYRYSGLQRESDREKYGARLIEWARVQGYRVRSGLTLAAYDPPWTIWFLRRNEVLVDVEPVTPTELAQVDPGQ